MGGINARLSSHDKVRVPRFPSSFIPEHTQPRRFRGCVPINPSILPRCGQPQSIALPQWASSHTASQLISPAPMGSAASSMSNVGVWTPLVMPRSSLRVPRR